MSRRFTDWLKRRKTDIILHAPQVVLSISALVGLAVVFKAPEVHTRKDADGLAATFGVLLAVIVAITAVYAAVALKRRRLRNYALITAGAGCLACLAGLLSIPLDLYRYALAVAFAAVVDSGLTMLILLME